ncbi:hypothetical protein ACFQ51_46995 [Streptomyces kaempferi]
MGGQSGSQQFRADLRIAGRTECGRPERLGAGRQQRAGKGELHTQRRRVLPGDRGRTHLDRWQRRSTASALLGSDAGAAESSLLSTQQSWWANYWANCGMLEANSADGQAQYMESLRTIYLFMEAASMRAPSPAARPG